MKKPSHKAARKAKRPAPAPAAPRPAPAKAPAVTAGAEASFQAAFAAHRAGQIAQAEAGYRETLRRQSTHPHALNNLAILLRGGGGRHYDEALDLYSRLLAITPAEAHAHSNLACLLADMNRPADALARARRAVALKPDYADACFNIGNCLRSLGDKAGAMTAYRWALRAKPAMGEATANKASLHVEAVELTQAVESFIEVVRTRPDLAAAFNGLGEALKEQGRIEEALTVFQQGLQQHPTCVPMHSNLLFALHYTPAVPPDVIFQAHTAWADHHARPLLPAGRRFANDRDGARRLRIGYVSPDFTTHSCSYFSEPLIREHDRTTVEVFCYMTSARQDQATARFRALADHWRSLVGLEDEAAAAVIEQDRIDILVDLAGHTGDSRLLVFARKPAPVQVTWLGYPDTTGMAAMDYRFTDAVADPPGDADRLHSERLVRLPGGFLAFQPVIDAPAAIEGPAIGGAATEGMAATGAGVTFGSFNNLAKVSPDVVRVWSEILRRVPGSRLIVKSRPLGDAGTLERYRALFASHGMGPDRVELLPRMEPVTNHLRAYDRVDIGLDPFPYNGTTTTCEALWMGVPVIARRGNNHVSRVGASLLTTCGLPELIAEDEAGYIAAAVALANDPPRRTEYRRTMRDRLQRSPLTDYAGFARSVEAAYRRMWQTWLTDAAR